MLTKQKGHYLTRRNSSHCNPNISVGFNVHRHVDFGIVCLYALHLGQSFSHTLLFILSPPGRARLRRSIDGAR